MTTGPAHWNLLQRARAVDNQIYIAAVSPARSSNPDDYQAWGHSSVVSPWGVTLVSHRHPVPPVENAASSLWCRVRRRAVPPQGVPP